MPRGEVGGYAADLPVQTPLSGRSGMSRLVMLSDATGVRAYARVMPDRIPAQQHQSGYGACKDARERANTVQTRHLDALWRITTAGLLVAKEYELHRQRLGTDGTDLVFPSRRTRDRGRSRPAKGGGSRGVSTEPACRQRGRPGWCRFLRRHFQCGFSHRGRQGPGSGDRQVPRGGSPDELAYASTRSSCANMRATGTWRRSG